MLFCKVSWGSVWECCARRSAWRNQSNRQLLLSFVYLFYISLLFLLLRNIAVLPGRRLLKGNAIACCIKPQEWTVNLEGRCQCFQTFSWIWQSVAIFHTSFPCAHTYYYFASALFLKKADPKEKTSLFGRLRASVFLCLALDVLNATIPVGKLNHVALAKANKVFHTVFKIFLKSIQQH